MGRGAAEDGRQGSARRRRTGPVGRLDRQAVQGRGSRLIAETARQRRASPFVMAVPGLDPGTVMTERGRLHRTRISRHESVAMTVADAPAAPRSRRLRWLPYILSLPALIVCIGILIPFVTAVYYSMLRYRLNLPALKGFIW